MSVNRSDAMRNATFRPTALIGVAMAAAVALVVSVAPARAQTAPAASNPELGRISDPFEGFNRGVYGFNNALDRGVIRPVAMTYKRTLPREARSGVHNVLGNLGEPVVFFNDVLQVRPTNAVHTAVRFGVNSTIGVLGLFDVASQLKVYRHGADFGQTLGRYGVGTGPYVYLPVFGPSSLRDTVGLAVNLTANPLNYARFDGDTAVKVAIISANVVDARLAVDKDLRDLQRSATDPYVTTRSVWVQNRRAFINGDKPPSVNDLPDFTPEAASKPN